MGLYENVAPVDASILAPDKRFVVNGTFEDHGVQPWEAAGTARRCADEWGWHGVRNSSF
jgi:hypothetical protein